MQDGVLGLRVSAAITSNKLLRLDNPITRDRLRQLKRKVDAAFAGGNNGGIGGHAGASSAAEAAAAGAPRHAAAATVMAAE